MTRFSCLCTVSLLVAGCSKKEKAGGPPPPATGSAMPAGSAAPTGSAAAMPAQPEKPQAPPELRKGDNRIVNLLHDDADKPMPIDVWGKRSFEYGPMQFATNIGYGEATPYFGVPQGTSTIAVPAGAGEQGKEVGSLFPAKDGEEITMVMFRDDGRTRSTVMGMKPPKLHNAPEPPPAGKGLVYMYAGPLRNYEDKLKEKFGGTSFYVGDGSKTCLRQRVEDAGKQAAILGGTNTTAHDVKPGKVRVTLHSWLGGKKCDSPAVAEFEVEVADGKGTFVILHSPDAGGSLAAMQLPMWK